MNEARVAQRKMWLEENNGVIESCTELAEKFKGSVIDEHYLSPATLFCVIAGVESVGVWWVMK